MSSYRPPRLAVTMGDPAGIGPEICLHLLNNASLAGGRRPAEFWR
jgi:4-hydroxy-L-threonine phosphate dehydrogenase PdxA